VSEKPRKTCLIIGQVQIGKASSTKLGFAILDLGDDPEATIGNLRQKNLLDPNALWTDRARLPERYTCGHYTKRWALSNAGDVVTIEHEPDNRGTVFPDTAKPTSIRLQAEERQAFRIFEEAELNHVKVNRQRKKEAGDRSHYTCLDPWRERYSNARSLAQKQVIIANMLAYLTDSRPIPR
jgi:hypothetical protein